MLFTIANFHSQVEESIKQLNQLKFEYDQVSGKTNPLFTVSGKLSAEQVPFFIF